MSRRWARGKRAGERRTGGRAVVRGLVAVWLATCVLTACGARGQAARTTGPLPLDERAVAASISETRMVETVRTLVAFGPRLYGTPSNHSAAAWLAAAYREAGLEATVREDQPREWYQARAWAVTVSGAAGGAPSSAAMRLASVWPSAGSPSGRGEGPVSIGAADGAVCLLSAAPTPENTAGCAAVLFDGRTASSGWPVPNRLRGTWTIPVFAVAARETAPLRARVGAGDPVRVTFSLDAETGRGPAHTVVATLPGRDRSKYVLFCAHGDADSGGPGANDNASGVAITLEIARAAGAAIKDGRLPQPAWDLRFATWGGEMTSSRQYVATMAADGAALQGVFNFDQSGFGSFRDALYVEPDDITINTTIIGVVRDVMRGHLGQTGFPQHAASIKNTGGTDSYVFQDTRTPGATVYPSVTLYSSAWDKAQTYPHTAGYPPIGWYADEQPGMVTVDGDAFYHTIGDTPEHTTDREPFNMGWCARVGLLSAWRLMSGPVR